MPPQLVALTEGPNILLDKPILLLGRHQECDIQLGSRKVSRRHCCLAQVNDYLVVRDLGSTNGIRINGARVVEGSLHAGDELTIGNQRYRVQWNAKAGDPLSSMKPEPAPPREKHPTRAPADDDDRLESSDHPVALDESGSLAKRRPDLFAAVPVAAMAPPAAPPGPPPEHNAGPEPAPLVVPEDVRLKPLGGENQAPAQ